MRLFSFAAAAVLGTAMTALPPASLLAQSADSVRASANPAADMADTTVSPVLPLDEAISLALKHNPDHLTTVDARRAVSAQKRAAYGAFLPRFDANLQGVYQQAGSQPINGVNFSVNSDIYQSFYGLSLTYNLTAATFVNPHLQSANVQAADADIAGSAQTVRTTVTQNYLTVLQDMAKAALQDTLVVQNQVQLELAKAKMAVGSGTQLDVNQAEVALGQAKVASLQAHNQVEVDKLRLFQTMGVPQPANVRLTTTFDVRQPTFALDSVMDLARQQNPALNALRSRDKVAALEVRTRQAQYLPSLQVRASWGGYTYQYANSDYPVTLAQQNAALTRSQCLTTDSLRVGAGLPGLSCPTGTLTPQQIASIRSSNSQFPFNFTNQPFQLSAGFSLPIFDGFQREQQIEQAKADRNRASYAERKQELQLTADVTAAYLTLVADAKAVELQEQNAAKATEELQLAQEKYKVGAATYLDLANARATYTQAQNDRINAIYTYHSAFAQLENAVGRPLR
jgi:outer membrane protein